MAETPYDLQGAGLGDTEQDTPSLINTLRSQGSMSNAALQMMMQPQGGGLMQALAGGVALMKNRPNPVAEQNAQGFQQRQQMANFLMNLSNQEANRNLRILEFKEKERDRKDALNLRKQTARDKLLDQMIEHGGPAAKEYAWLQKGSQLEAQGMPKNIIQELSAGGVTPETMKEIVLDLRTGVPEDVVSVIHKVAPSQIQYYKTKVNDPEWLTNMGIKTKDETDRDRQIKEEDHAVKVQMAKLQEMDADRRWQHEIRLANEAVERAKREDRKDTIAEARLAELQASGKRADIRLQAYLDNLGKKEKEKASTFDVMDEWLNNIDSTGAALEKKHYLPKTSAGVVGGLLTGNTSAARADMNKRLFGNDTDFVLWTQILQGGGVGFERSIQKDLGPRALAAYKGILKFGESPPPIDAIQRASKYMRSQIEIARGGKAPKEETVVYRQGGKTFEVKQRRGMDTLPPDAEILTVDGEKVP